MLGGQGSAGVSTGRRAEPACGPGGTSPGTPWRPPHADGALRNGEDESPPGGSAGAKRHAPAAQGVWWRVVSASVPTAPRSRLLHAHRKEAALRLPDSIATAAWPASAASVSRVG